MKRLTMLGFALLIGVIGCDAEEQQEYADSAAEIEEAGERTARATGEAVREAGRDIRLAFRDIDADTDAVVTEDEFQRWWDRNNPFDDWDVDADARLDEDEFGVHLEVRHFEELDANDDGMLTREELNDGLFDAIDENGDGRVQREEWPRS